MTAAKNHFLRRATFSIRKRATGEIVARLQSKSKAIGFARGYNAANQGDEVELVPEAVTVRYADDAEPIKVKPQRRRDSDKYDRAYRRAFRKWPQQFKNAERLSKLVPGRLIVDFCPDMPGDDGVSGHTYIGGLDPEFGVDVEFLMLDDRKPESLESQFAAGLRQAARAYLSLARQVERAIE
jgi:hypothetical protein